MNKEKILKIIVAIAIIIDLIIFGSLLYNNKQLKKEIAYLKYNYKELQDSVSAQRENVSYITSKIDEMAELLDDEKKQKMNESDPYYEAINNLDNTIFLTDFENYAPNDNDIKITEKEAKEIAQKGFEESKSRIAREGTDDVDSETIKIEEVVANNYFTRYYYQGNQTYDSIKRNCYAIQRQNGMGCGATIYVDATTGLIVGGRAFGD